MPIAEPAAAEFRPTRVIRDRLVKGGWALALVGFMGFAWGCAGSPGREWAQNSPLISPSEIGAPAPEEAPPGRLASVDSAVAGGTVEN